MELYTFLPGGAPKFTQVHKKGKEERMRIEKGLVLSAAASPLVRTGGSAPYFDAPIPKNRKDTDTFRVRATVKMDNRITAMFGFAINDNPVLANGGSFHEGGVFLPTVGIAYAY